MKQFYQGDVPILQINQEQIKQELKYSPLKTEGVVVAYGEVTGHTHTVKSREGAEIEIAQDQNGFYLKVNKGEAEIVHQEHPPITFGAGLWFLGKQYEWNEIEERKVLD